MTTKQILGTAVGLGSTALAVKSAKMAKNQMKHPSSKKLIKGMVDLTVGMVLLIPTAKLVNKL